MSNIKPTKEDILKNDKVFKMWKELKVKVYTKEELDELRIKGYDLSF